MGSYAATKAAMSSGSCPGPASASASSASASADDDDDDDDEEPPRTGLLAAAAILRFFPRARDAPKGRCAAAAVVRPAMMMPVHGAAWGPALEETVVPR
ncbi:hypothetical protein CDD83_4939 [Cordyceps sp. RAO-2017]|nr:hypothetical protein CDD83_4939 [Cordyceps sp. RAO-2017]